MDVASIDLASVDHVWRHGSQPGEFDCTAARVRAGGKGSTVHGRADVRAWYVSGRPPGRGHPA
jgi:hypothetical protein